MHKTNYLFTKTTSMR